MLLAQFTAHSSAPSLVFRAQHRGWGGWRGWRGVCVMLSINMALVCGRFFKYPHCAKHPLDCLGQWLRFALA